VTRVSPIELSGRITGFNSVRSDIFVETPATVRSSLVEAAYSSRGQVQMSPLRGLRFFVCGLATNMPLLMEFGVGAVLEHEAAL
jgi:hypothetical protein